MNYLVVQRRDKGRVGISVVDGSTVYNHEHTAWAIRTGKQVHFVHMRMANVLKNFHVGGSYQDFAWYAMDYEELKSLITLHMGPSDSDRYLEALSNIPKDSRETIDWPHKAYVAVRLLGIVFKVCWAFVKMAIFFVGVPLVLRWFKNSK